MDFILNRTYFFKFRHEFYLYESNDQNSTVALITSSKKHREYVSKITLLDILFLALTDSQTDVVHSKFVFHLN